MEPEVEVYTQLEHQLEVRTQLEKAPSPSHCSSITIAPASSSAGPSRVKAFVRVRPLSDSELERGEEPCTHVEQHRIHVDAVKRAERSFDFDDAFDCDSSNQQVYEAVGNPVVRAALNGYNGTLIAYGQTGSGKTHTLTCVDGLLPRIAAAVFDHIGANPRFKFKVAMDYIQIYKDKVYDLLAAHDTPLRPRELPDKGIELQGSAKVSVTSAADFFEALERGRRRLVFASTQMNRHSSRSHAVCLLSIDRSPEKGNLHKTGSPLRLSRVSAALGRSIAQASESAERGGEILDFAAAMGEEAVKDCTAQAWETPVPEATAGNAPQPEFDEQAKEWCKLVGNPVADSADDEVEDAIDEVLEGVRREVVVRGKLTICDLAGSERIKRTGAEGDRLGEAQHINRSLFELGNVIAALAQAGKVHVPFRNCVLTRILGESLGGNCKTSLIVCVSPGSLSQQETITSLEFGARAMCVQNAPKVNVEVDFKAIVEELQDAMAKQALEYEEKISALEMQLQQKQQKQQKPECKDASMQSEANGRRMFTHAEVCELLENGPSTRDASVQHESPEGDMLHKDVQTDDASVQQNVAECQCDLFSDHQMEAGTQTENGSYCETSSQTEEVDTRKSVSDVEILVETPRPYALELDEYPKLVGCVNQTPLPEEELPPDSPLLATVPTSEAAQAYAWTDAQMDQTKESLPTCCKGLCCCYCVCGS